MISFKETYHYYNHNLKRKKKKRKNNFVAVLFSVLLLCFYLHLLYIGCLFQYCCWALYVYDKYENKYNDKKETERKILSSIFILCLCFL